jgi:hypothetical protein
MMQQAAVSVKDELHLLNRRMEYCDELVMCYNHFILFHILPLRELKFVDGREAAPKGVGYHDAH